MSKRNPISQNQPIQPYSSGQGNQTSLGQHMTSSNSGIFPPIDNLQQFRQCLVMSLSKFGDPQTIKQAADEIRELMTEHITNTDRMNAFLLLLQEHNEHMKPNHRKELIKIYGTAAEIFEEALLPFMPKILTYLQRKLKENDSLLHQVISDALGAMVHQVLKKIESLDELLNQFNPILKMIFTNLMTPNRQLQIGSAISLTRVIQNAPVLVLQSSLPFISSKILESLSAHTCKCQTQILESLISLILAVENEFSNQCADFLPQLLECMTNSDWQVRKMAIDVIYTMAAILRDALVPFKNDILEVLNHSRSDKIKPVREATLEAMQAVKEIQTGQQQVKSEETPSVRGRESFKRPPTSQNRAGAETTLGKNTSQRYQREMSPDNFQQFTKKNAQRNDSTQNMNRSSSRVPGQITNRSKAEDMAKSDNEGQGTRKNLTSATQKKIARQQEANLPQTSSRMQAMPKTSIFKGPKNTGFFSKQGDDIEILEGSRPHEHENEQETSMQMQDQQQEDISIKIYEGKKRPLYQDQSRLEHHLLSSQKQSDLNYNSGKKVSPFKKNFLEQSEILSDQKHRQFSHNKNNDSNVEQIIDSLQRDNENQSSPSNHIDKSYFSPGLNNQIRYQQPNHSFIQGTNNLPSSYMQPIGNSSQDFMNFNVPQQQPPQIMTGLHQNMPPLYQQQISPQNFYHQQSYPQTQIGQPSPLSTSNDQQIQFLIQELQKINQSQSQVIERMNEYQNYQKNEIFSLQARIAKLEDIVQQQQQQNILKSSIIQPQLMQQPQLMTNYGTQPIIDQRQSPISRGRWNNNNNNQSNGIQNNVSMSLNHQPKSLWQQIQTYVHKAQLNEAYKLILQNDLNDLEDRDLLLIKLIGKTGVCLDKLDEFTIDNLLNRIIKILSEREFIDVLLPWMSSITQYLKDHKNSHNQDSPSKQQLSLNTLSNLIECLLLLLNDQGSRNGLNEVQRVEVEQIYLSISETLKTQ
ncbi:microtubule-associated protein tortifolia1-like [Stylonychia lemnae]|uniref:Microtubule-associated protein tortifolia1-like n=1 Tax=Stylonychia lemnae TaxID=5949 RepID=A0A078BBG6_STYLE|nr:microtubule-associated protein tortifolia1-like [Stylonychia lemnae]|eukprot:CDW90612.1 microtubule-associated protein tortifolia1-like [Stylonychia lemnae]